MMNYHMHRGIKLLEHAMNVDKNVLEKSCNDR